VNVQKHFSKVDATQYVVVHYAKHKFRRT